MLEHPECDENTVDGLHCPRWYGGGSCSYCGARQPRADRPCVIETSEAPQQQGNEVECPLCKGSGDREFFDTTRGPHGESYTVNCDRCGGSGAVAADGGGNSDG